MFCSNHILNCNEGRKREASNSRSIPPTAQGQRRESNIIIGNGCHDRIISPTPTIIERAEQQPDIQRFISKHTPHQLHPTATTTAATTTRRQPSATQSDNTGVRSSANEPALQQHAAVVRLVLELVDHIVLVVIFLVSDVVEWPGGCGGLRKWSTRVNFLFLLSTHV